MGLLKLIGELLLIFGVFLFLIFPIGGIILIVLGLLFIIAGKDGGAKQTQYAHEFKIYPCKKCQKETKHNKIGKSSFGTIKLQCQECGRKI